MLSVVFEQLPPVHRDVLHGLVDDAVHCLAEDALQIIFYCVERNFLMQLKFEFLSLFFVLLLQSATTLVYP